MNDHHGEQRRRRFGRRRRPSFPLEPVEASEQGRSRNMEPADEPSLDIESALIDRLRSMEWPKPSTEVRERCLSQILDRMEELGEDEEAEASPGDPSSPRPQGRAHGHGERHPTTRRVAVSHRTPLSLPDRPVRLAAVL